MASLAAIRTGVKTTLEANISGLYVYDTFPENPQLPAAMVWPVKSDFNAAMQRGMDVWQFDLFVIVRGQDAALSQADLDSYVTGAGTKSIRQVIYNNEALGLSDGTIAHAEGVVQYGRTFTVAGIQHIGAVMRLTVRTPGTA